MNISTIVFLEEELPLREVVTSSAGWLVHGQQLNPLDLLQLNMLNRPSEEKNVL